MEIKDSGNRREFKTGARRDRAEGKGLPTLISPIFVQQFLDFLDKNTTVQTNELEDNYRANIKAAIDMIYKILEGDYSEKLSYMCACEIMVAMQCQKDHTQEVTVFYPIFFDKLAKQLEGGAKKYGLRNWEQGMPLEEYLNSLLRHLLQWYDGQEDEPHDGAAAFNIMCYCHTREMIKREKLPLSLSYLPDFINHNGSKVYDMAGNEKELPDPRPTAAEAAENLNKAIGGLGDIH